jgi:hypothetical protein
MARLRQYFASRYGSQESTSAEFENIIRYLNSAELGNQTVAELMSKIFDADGEVALGIGLRFDPATGIEFRQSADGEWSVVASAADIRGVPGVNLGTVEGPLLSNRSEFISTSGQVAFSYSVISAVADLMVWVNGVLQLPTAYAYTSSTLTLATSPAAGSNVTVATIRANPSAAFLRLDIQSADAQVVFPFPLGEFDEVIVLLNGIMQREGGGFDYIKSWQSGVITMTSAQTSGSYLTVIRISNNNINDVAGLMLEDTYCSNGMLLFNKLAIPAGAILQSKVSGLESELGSKPTITIGISAPVGAIPGDLWVNNSAAVQYMLFFDGTNWINSSPNGLIPNPTTLNALQYLRLNSTSTALEYANIDFSSLLATSTRGEVNGVAPLDSSGLVPASSLPTFVTRSPISGIKAGAIVNGTFTVSLMEDKYVVDGITLALSAGTATVQLSIGGVLVGSTVAVTTTPSRLAIASSNINASIVPQVVSLVVTGAASATDLAFVVGALLIGD